MPGGGAGRIGRAPHFGRGRDRGGVGNLPYDGGRGGEVAGEELAGLLNGAPTIVKSEQGGNAGAGWTVPAGVPFIVYVLE